MAAENRDNSLKALCVFLLLNFGNADPGGGGPSCLVPAGVEELGGWMYSHPHQSHSSLTALTRTRRTSSSKSLRSCWRTRPR